MSSNVPISSYRHTLAIRPPEENNILHTLPSEIIQNILRRLDIQTLLKLRPVCSYFRDTIEDLTFFGGVVDQQISPDFPRPKEWIRLVRAFVGGTCEFHSRTNLACYAIPTTAYFFPQVAFGKNNNIVSATPEGITVWNLESGKYKVKDKGEYQIGDCVAFSPNGDKIAFSSRQNHVMLWDLENGQCTTLSRHTKMISSIAFSPNGESIASGSYDTTIKIWQNNKQDVLKGHTSTVFDVVFSKNYLVSGSSKAVMVWDLTSKRCISLLVGHKAGISSVTISPNEETIIYASFDRTIRRWDFKAKKSAVLVTSRQPLTKLALSPNGKTIAYADDDGVRLLDIATKEMDVIYRHRDRSVVTSVAFSPDGKKLVSSAFDSTIMVYYHRDPIKVWFV